MVGAPVTKGTDWYLQGREERQGIMNEPMRIGHEYPEVGQLLANSFGIDDMDFLVAYETDDLTLFGQLVRELRVGDQQLIEIAKALSLETDILIMDEPTSALTESEVARLFRVIGRLRERGVTVLYISHRMDEVFRLADRIAVLRDGRLV